MEKGIDGAETFTQRCRRMLTDQPDQAEFNISRVGLETLVSGSERCGEATAAANAVLLTARDIASSTTMMTRNSDAWLNGEWDSSLPRVLREIADGRLRPIGATPVAQGDEVRDALEPFIRIAPHVLHKPNARDGQIVFRQEEYRDGEHVGWLTLKLEDFARIDALATLTKGARDAG